MVPPLDFRLAFRLRRAWKASSPATLYTTHTHSTHYTLYTLYTLHSTLHTLYTIHFTHYTLHTMHTSLYTLAPWSSPAPCRILHSASAGRIERVVASASRHNSSCKVVTYPCSKTSRTASSSSPSCAILQGGPPPSEEGTTLKVLRIFTYRPTRSLSISRTSSSP